MPEMPDELLMAAVKNGDQRAFRTIFERYGKIVYRFLYRLLKDPSLAEEAVQEVFIKLYQSAQTYQPRGKLITFLYRIALNHSLNELRKREQKVQRESLSTLPEDRYRAPSLKEEVGPEEELRAVQLKEFIEKWLDELSQAQRAALLMHRVDGLSYNEIAEVLNTSLSSVKSLIHRAKKKLKDKLDKLELETTTQGELSLTNLPLTSLKKLSSD